VPAVRAALSVTVLVDVSIAVTVVFVGTPVPLTDEPTNIDVIELRISVLLPTAVEVLIVELIAAPTYV
jgi:hypothetical protein